ncbi:MAG: SIMPL domain-containing protein [Burkholderiales bacterium]|nr:SIMPL domain-containing protein [Burkholderiales bacterium]
MSNIKFSISVLLGFIILSGSLVYINKNKDTLVQAKGVAEVKVKSDLATWQISLNQSGYNLASAYNQMESDQSNVIAILKDQGIQESDIQSNNISISNMLIDNKTQYQIYNTITVSSKNVDSIYKINQNQKLFIDKGIFISGSYVNYYFTAINNIKEPLLKDSVLNTKISAGKIAGNLNKEIAEVRNINQGVISVNSADGSQYNDINSLYKTVRVVTTATYLMK